MDANALLIAVFSALIEREQLTGLGTEAWERIADYLKRQGLFDPLTCDVIVSTVALKVLDSLERREAASSIGSFQSYFLVACRNEAIDHVKEESRLRTVSLETLDSLRELRRSPDASLELPFTSLCDEARAATVYERALETLAPRDQALVSGALLVPKSDRELAEEMGMELSSYRVACFRAMRRFRAAVKLALATEVVTIVDRPATAPTPSRGGAG